MNYKTWRHSIGTVLIAAMVLTFAGCADGDYATVRIETGIDTQHITLLDKVLKFITMSRTLYAQETPGDIDKLTIKVSGPGMKTIEEVFEGNENIPSVVTLFVPSGENRRIEVVAVVNPDVAAEYDIGGVITKNLVPGEEVSIQMYMLGIPYGINEFGEDIGWFYDESDNIPITKFLLYSADPIMDGAMPTEQPPPSDNYSLIYEGYSEFDTGSYIAPGFNIDEAVWYKVRAYKEGILGFFSEEIQGEW